MDSSRDTVIEWAIRLQSIAQNGLAYCSNKYDRQRSEELRNLATEMMAEKSGVSLQKVKDLFCCEKGYQTPKIDTRAAIVKNQRILLVEQDGKWSLPGGWAEVNLSVAENCIKENKEETGLDTVVDKVVALQEYNLHNQPPLSPFGICKIFFLCHAIAGQFHQNIETQGYDYFSFDQVSRLNLNTRRSTLEQINMCFAAAKDPYWSTKWD